MGLRIYKSPGPSKATMAATSGCMPTWITRVSRMKTPIFAATLVDTLEAQKTLLFLPNRLTDGIELSDDRLPVIRSEVYVLAFARRAR